MKKCSVGLSNTNFRLVVDRLNLREKLTWYMCNWKLKLCFAGLPNLGWIIYQPSVGVTRQESRQIGHDLARISAELGGRVAFLAEILINCSSCELGSDFPRVPVTGSTGTLPERHLIGPVTGASFSTFQRRRRRRKEQKIRYSVCNLSSREKKEEEEEGRTKRKVPN